MARFGNRVDISAFVRSPIHFESRAFELMRGFVPTPAAVVDLMVAKLFGEEPPPPGATVLDPGCGDGAFIDGVLRYCYSRGWQTPRIVGIELDPTRARPTAQRFRGRSQVEIREQDFLAPLSETFDYVIGNPPYVAIDGLSADERAQYRAMYRTARGRFDLYLLFFEQALRALRLHGRLVFITPEKYLYVETARAMRELLQHRRIEELHFVSESTFGTHVTYPLITTLSASRGMRATQVIARDGQSSRVTIRTSDSWLPIVRGCTERSSSLRLADVTTRISCGVATGADGVFVVPTVGLPHALSSFAYPTLSGRELVRYQTDGSRSSLLAPYDRGGRLLSEEQLGALGTFLGEPHRRKKLTARSCVSRKPWYAFHDSLPLTELMRPKLLCKDICERPQFVADRTGEIVPRHSVYYIVPSDESDLDALLVYLNSDEAVRWLFGNCQRAAGGFLRLQSHVLKRMPVPPHVTQAGKARLIASAGGHVA